MQRFQKLVCAFLLLGLSGWAVAGDVLVYTGEGGQDWATHDKFGVATGKTVYYESTLPADLSAFDCVILPINVEGFTGATLAALNAYTNGGGRLIAEAEHNRASGAYLGAIDAMNAVAADLGSAMSVLGDYLDCGFNVTTNIHPSPFTDGVTEILMACTSEVAVAVAPTAHSLVGTPSLDITFIGAEKIGSGMFFLLGDGNTLSDGSFDGYENYDNGLLAANLCDQASLGIEVAIDIKFCSDPNAFNCRKKGVLPVTIFGTADFDVASIDISTLKLCTEGPELCTQAPRDFSYADRGDPTSDLGAAMCRVLDLGDGVFEEQDYLNPDGFIDLDIAFEANEVQDILEVFCSFDKGTVSEPLIITGMTLDGTEIFSVPVPHVGVDQLLKVNK